jgi:hypothetical protein
MYVKVLSYVYFSVKVELSKSWKLGSPQYASKWGTSTKGSFVEVVYEQNCIAILLVINAFSSYEYFFYVKVCFL